MPKETVIDLQGKSLNELAGADPELMLLWGQINNAWDEIERLLYVAFDSMLSEESHYATQAVFYSQTSHAARRTMVASLLEYALLNRPQTARKLQNAIKRVKARSDDRNKLTHGIWTMGVDLKTGEHGLHRTVLDPKLIPDPGNAYSHKRLVEVRDKMRDTAKALAEAISPIECAKRAHALELTARHMEKTRLLEPPTSQRN
jgi:hypothetical protein